MVFNFSVLSFVRVEIQKQRDKLKSIQINTFTPFEHKICFVNSGLLKQEHFSFRS
jgi:hypothetical protein